MDRMGVIAIDGPAGAGKSTVARSLAERLGVRYLDTGALYRALSLWLDEQGVAPQESVELRDALDRASVRIEGRRIFVDDRDVTDAIRTSRVAALSSAYSALPMVRDRLLDLQREQALAGPLVADGRDMGTVVFPLAPLKIFLTASVDVRSRRRWDELNAKGEQISLETLRDQIVLRDRQDCSRTVAPLVRAEDAVLIDSSNMTVDQVVTYVLEQLEGLCHGK